MRRTTSRPNRLAALVGRLLLCLAVLGFHDAMLAEEPALMTAEYFWDADPGEGSGTVVSIPVGQTLILGDASAPALTVDVTQLSPGPHRLGLRVRDTSLRWSDVNWQPVQVQDVTGLLAGVTSWPPVETNVWLVAAEYFWDTDPGTGNGTAFSIPRGETLILGDSNAPALNVPLASVSEGTHQLGIRTRDASGRWSEINWQPVQVQDVTALLAGVTSWPPAETNKWLVAAEYFWDIDPGQGNGTTVAIPPGETFTAGDSNSPAVSVPVPRLPLGVHQLGLRVRQADGTWSEPMWTGVLLDRQSRGFTHTAVASFANWPAHGVAIADFDGDGLEDVFFADTGGPSHLLRNLGGGQFATVTNLPGGFDLPASSGAWADYDNDGHTDLFITRGLGPCILFRNRGDGTFEDVTMAAGITDAQPGSAATWVDYDRDGFVDLYVSAFNNQNDRLYRNRGDGMFEAITVGPAVNDGGNSHGVAFGDFDGDGWPDLVVANRVFNSQDQNEFLYRNDRNGGFIKVTADSVVLQGGDSFAPVWGDFDGDGDLDLYVVNYNQAGFLYRNDGGHFTLIDGGPLSMNMAGGFSGQWIDYNDDGKLDMFVTGFSGFADRLLQGAGTDFVLAPDAAGLTNSVSGQGQAWFDADGNGTLDVVVASTFGEQSRLYLNDGSGAAWLGVRLIGRASNRSAIGAVLRASARIDGNLTTLRRDIVGANGYASDSGLRAHFGLGDATNVDLLRVEWPSGLVTTLSNVPPNQLLTIEELPLGTPVVRVNGRFSSTNRFEIPATNSAVITLISSFTPAEIHYTLTDPNSLQPPDAGSPTYDGPIVVSNTVSIWPITYDDLGNEAIGVPVTVEIVPLYALAASTPGGGSVSNSNASGPYLSNTLVTLTAIASNGWQFMNWAGDAASTNPVLHLTMNGPRAVQAVFGTFVTNAVTGSGSVLKEPAQGLHPYGSIARLSAVPAASRYFLHWTNAATGSQSPLSFVVTNANQTVRAVFGTIPNGTPTNFTLTVLINSNGVGAVTKSPLQGFYPSNTVVMLTAVPDPGNAFAGWSGDASGTQTNLNVLMNANKVITANFLPTAPPVITAQPQSLTVNRDSNATITVSVTGVPTPTFQWFHAGTNLPGATAPTLTIASAQKADGGSYSVVVSNALGSATSAVAVLTVDLPYTWITLAGLAGEQGTNDGSGSAARFSTPAGVAVDNAGNLYVGDENNYTIRKVSPLGAVTTLAGLAQVAGGTDGTGSVARFFVPVGVAVDGAGNVFVADEMNRTLRRVTPAGVVTTIAGTATSLGTNDGTGTEARFHDPVGLALDTVGNLYVSDYFNFTIRKVTPVGTNWVVTTLAGEAGSQGSVDGTGSAARFYYAFCVAVDTAGNVYVGDGGNSTIRKITPTGMVTTLAGEAGSQGTSDGTNNSARFYNPIGVAVDGAGNVFVVDVSPGAVRKITPAGVVTTIGGRVGVQGSMDGTGSAATFKFPRGVAVDGLGNIYVTGGDDYTIRKGIPDYGQPIIYGQPQSQTAAASSLVTLGVTNSGASPLGYQWLFNGTNLAGATAATLSFANFQAADAGPYFVVVSNVYGMATSSVAVLSLPAVTNQPPVVAIMSPADGATFTAPASIGISASASDADGSVTQVLFYAGATLLGRVTNAPFDFTWNGASVGGYSLTAVATDNGGLSSTSSIVNITVTPPANQPPVVQILSPTNGESFVTGTNIAITASAADIDGSVVRVEFFYEDTNSIGIVSNAPFTIVWSNVAAGAYSLAARATDNQGATTVSAATGITVSSGATVTPVFSFATNSYTVVEAETNVLIVVRKNAGGGAGLVNFATEPGSAKSYDSFPDFTAAQGVLAFQANETSKTISIAIHNDQVWESNQFFTVTLTPGPGAEVLPGADVTTVTILDDDLGTTNSITQILSPGSPETNLSSLRVNLQLAQPPNEAAPGQWRFTSESGWRDGGTSASNLSGGNYEVEFKPVSGFTAPDRLPLAVLPGTNQVETFYYTNSGAAQVGSLSVTLLPGSVGPAAGWRQVGESSYHASGATVDALPVGSYLIEFNPVNGWVEPGRQLVTVEANRVSSDTAQYTVAAPGAGTLPSQVSFGTVTAFGANQPYTFLGQIQSDAGWGSGWVAKERVVLTAAHVVYDDVEFTYVPVGQVKWFFQRYVGNYEPAPKLPRGSCVFAGYAAQRETEATPGFSSVTAQNLDVAALYFFEPAARRSEPNVPGGYGGYLVSRPGQSGQEWLFNSSLKVLAGYPVEGRDAANNPVVPGRVYGAGGAPPPSFDPSPNRVYSTLNIQGLPGMSGGPLCVQSVGNSFFPAAVYLGGSQRTVARVIDEDVAGLIICAEIAADAGEDNTGGEPPRPGCNTCPLGIYGYLEVTVQPANVLASGGGYYFTRAPSVLYRNPFTNFAVLGNVPQRLQFLDAPFSIAPASRTITTAAGHTNRVLATYKTWGQIRALGGNAFQITGSSNTVYRIESSPRLGASAVWTPVRFLTNNAASTMVTNLPTSPTSIFFRAVLVP